MHVKPCKSKKKKDVKETINKALDFWTCSDQLKFMKEVVALFRLYDVDEENDWVEEIVGTEDLQNVRLMRTMIIISRIAEFHGTTLFNFKLHFPNLYKEMEDHVASLSPYQDEKMLPEEKERLIEDLNDLEELTKNSWVMPHKWRSNNGDIEFGLGTTFGLQWFSWFQAPLNIIDIVCSYRKNSRDKNEKEKEENNETTLQ